MADCQHKIGKDSLMASPVKNSRSYFRGGLNETFCACLGWQEPEYLISEFPFPKFSQHDKGSVTFCFDSQACHLDPVAFPFIRACPQNTMTASQLESSEPMNRPAIHSPVALNLPHFSINAWLDLGKVYSPPKRGQRTKAILQLLTPCKFYSACL